MAYDPQWRRTLKAEADLSAKATYVAKRGAASGGCDLCGVSDEPVGIIETGKTTGGECAIISFGTAHAIAGGQIALGAQLGVDSSGRVVTFDDTTHAWVIGSAEEAAGALGDVIEIKLAIRPGGVDLAALASVADGASGADKTGLTPIAETGAANSVQEFAEALVALLKAVADGAAGADLVGMTPIAETGAAATAQSVIEALITRLKAVADGASGADLIAITAVATLGAAASVQAAIEALAAQIGDLTALETTEKGSLVGAINEIHT